MSRRQLFSQFHVCISFLSFVQKFTFQKVMNNILKPLIGTQNNYSEGKTEGLLEHWALLRQQKTEISMDFMMGLPRIEKGHDMVVVDKFSKQTHQYIDSDYDYRQAVSTDVFSVDVENDVVTEDLGGFIYFSQLPDVGQKDDISALKRDGLHIHRCRLEKEVERLRATLQQEQEINFAFETALRSKPRAISDFGHLPINAQELLADIAMLEAAISSLEEQITLLLSHLGRECSQHQILETFDGKLSFNMSPVQQLLKTLSISTL